MEIEFKHKPIMAEQIVSHLCPKEGDFFVDGTLGGAGHASLIAILIGKSGTLLGIDKDADALQASAIKLAPFGNAVLVHNDFKNIKTIFEEKGIEQINGALLDLGVSSYQIDMPERGFSIRLDGPLDMRMDKRQELTAWTVVNKFTKDELFKIIKE